MDTAATDDDLAGSNRPVDTVLALSVAWAPDASLLGQVLLVPTNRGEHVFGRGAEGDDSPLPRLFLSEQRPKLTRTMGGLDNPFVSRNQFRVSSDGKELTLVNEGKRALLDEAGVARNELRLAPGQACEIKGQLVLVCVRRPVSLPPLRSWPQKSLQLFGEADLHGFVGESPLAWELRDQCAFVAGRAAHVLVLGESGSGKEVIARAIHALSPRNKRQLVSRNAATIPATLIDAELFGNVANYPQSGMPERLGLVGEADGSTLFLDEIGELPEELQTRLLRLLDDGGDYQRLGDAKRRTVNLRFIGATNRAASALKHDVAARLKLRLTLPGLNERREDIPLIARHLLLRAVRTDPDVGARFFEKWDGKRGEPRITAALARRLVTHVYRTHVRELDALLWCALASSPDGDIELTAEVEREFEQGADDTATERRSVHELPVEELRAALERADWVQERAWRDLGLANRHVLKRLVKKYGLKK